jgi:hypothetical protein
MKLEIAQGFTIWTCSILRVLGLQRVARTKSSLVQVDVLVARTISKMLHSEQKVGSWHARASPRVLPRLLERFQRKHVIILEVPAYAPMVRRMRRNIISELQTLGYLPPGTREATPHSALLPHAPNQRALTRASSPSILAPPLHVSRKLLS